MYLEGGLSARIVATAVSRVSNTCSLPLIVVGAPSTGPLSLSLLLKSVDIFLHLFDVILLFPRGELALTWLVVKNG